MRKADTEANTEEEEEGGTRERERRRRPERREEEGRERSRSLLSIKSTYASLIPPEPHRHHLLTLRALLHTECGTLFNVQVALSNKLSFTVLCEALRD